MHPEATLGAELSELSEWGWYWRIMEKRQPPRKTLKDSCQEHGFWGWTDRNLNPHSIRYFFSFSVTLKDIMTLSKCVSLYYKIRNVFGAISSSLHRASLINAHYPAAAQG